GQIDARAAAADHLHLGLLPVHEFAAARTAQHRRLGAEPIGLRHLGALAGWGGGSAPRRITHQIPTPNAAATARNVAANSQSVRYRIDCVSIRASSVSGAPCSRSASGCSQARMLPRLSMPFVL